MNLDDLVDAIARRQAEYLYLNELEMLGYRVQEKDRNEQWLLVNSYYRWHWACGYVLKPERVAEIGVRFGYSLASMLIGASDAGSMVKDVDLFDSECYEPGSMSIARRNVDELVKGVIASAVFDTQAVGNIITIGGPVDLFHVDGDHSYKGALHDMRLAWDVVKPGGVMLVDDHTFIHDVARACDEFAVKGGLNYRVLPTYRGTAVFRKPA